MFHRGYAFAAFLQGARCWDILRVAFYSGVRMRAWYSSMPVRTCDMVSHAGSLVDSVIAAFIVLWITGRLHAGDIVTCHRGNSRSLRSAGVQFYYLPRADCLRQTERGTLAFVVDMGNDIRVRVRLPLLAVPFAAVFPLGLLAYPLTPADVLMDVG